MPVEHEFSLGITLFSEMLNRRLIRGVPTTEDSVRYTFYSAVCHSLRLSPEEVILEYDHPYIFGARIDTWICSQHDKPYAIEFKYDRPGPSKTNQPLTQKAGHIFKDVFRLATLHNSLLINAIFVYLTTLEMVKYFSNTKSGISEFYNLAPGMELEIESSYLDSRAITLRRAAGEIVPCRVRTLLSRTLSNEHQLRVFEITRAT